MDGIPVLHMDFSGSKYTDADKLREVLNIEITKWEKIYGKGEGEHTFSTRFQGVIQRAFQQTGKQVVVLIDEYDSPLLDTNSEPTLQKELRNIVRDFFSPLKKNGQYLRFLFITGISKFSQLSIFSELNNLKNISMRDDFSALCGITETELLTQLKPDIERMAEANGETYEEACAHLKKQYDGYHFSENCEDIYNPFSLFNAFDAKKYKNYWFSTGTPTFLLDLLQEADFNIQDLEGVEVSFDTPSISIMDFVPMLYSYGYLTVKEYDPMFGMYKLGFPNDDVREGIQNWCELR